MNYGIITENETIQLDEVERGLKSAIVENHSISTNKYIFGFDVSIYQSYIVDRGDYQTPDSISEVGILIDVQNLVCYDVESGDEVKVAENMIKFITSNISYE